MLLMKKKHRDYKSLLQGAQMLLTLAVAIGVLFSSAPTADGFIASDHQNPRTTRKLNNLIRRVHKDQWVIGYAYAGPEWGEPAGVCPPEARNNGPAIEETIETALRAWLQPVKDLNTGKPVVDDFRFVPNYDVSNVAEFPLYDLRIVFFCDFDRSFALTAADEAITPAIKMHQGTEVDDRFASATRHEIGHSFGLLDTYPRLELTRKELRESKGGLGGTIGHQPSSVMSELHISRPGPRVISQDDKNGIVWLYKFYHENLPLEDCLFPDYELEKSPMGCRPKSPLLFEIKYGSERLARQIIEQDSNTDVNAKDETGLTALHYAVEKGYSRFLNTLLRRKVDVNATDAAGSTALFWAAKRGSYSITERLLKEKSIDVNVRGVGGNTPLKEAATQGNNSIVDLLLEQEAREAAWREIDATSLANYRSVFYLMPSDGRRLVFHLGYLGSVLGGDALFVAQQRKQDSRENIEKYLNRDDISLVGYDGLVAEDVNVRTLTSFPGANEKTGSVLLAIRDVDFSAYAPLALSSYPNVRETDVELLTYKFGLDIMLKGAARDKALALPLRVRRCVSVPHAGLGAVDLWQHTCGPANSVSEGSILFDEKNGTILGFYRSQEGSDILGDGLPLADVVSEGLIRLVDRKPVTPKHRLTTTWAEIKRMK